MKFYETHYEDYITSAQTYNIHPKLEDIYESLPASINQFGNIIMYGPSGVGKYTQVLKLLKKYSPTNLKYDKKVKIQTDKGSYIYRISDIHYEIDMAILGCSSKILWHEIFMQIVDIVSVKQNKIGIIVCKNFHLIHNELLEIFYSYIQHYNHPQTSIQLRYILVTEHISFIPNPITMCCKVISVNRPSKEDYVNIASAYSYNYNNTNIVTDLCNFTQKITTKNTDMENCMKIGAIMEEIDEENILNAKETRSFSLIENVDKIPPDIFNIVCNNIITQVENIDKLVFTEFRDVIYDILIYNLDATECIWHVLTHFIHNRRLSKKSVGIILNKMYSFLKYYNNNYRPIYHLESIFFTIITELYSYPKDKV